MPIVTRRIFMYNNRNVSNVTIKRGFKYLLTDNLGGYDSSVESLIDSDSGARTLWGFLKVLLLEHLTYDTDLDKTMIKDFLSESVERFSELLDLSEDLVEDMAEALISSVTSDTSLDNRDSVDLAFALGAILLEKTEDIESTITEVFEQLDESAGGDDE